MSDWNSAEAIKTWWSSPSQANYHRSHTAEDVAQLREPFAEGHHSNRMALKLRYIFAKHQAQKSINITMAPLDGVQQQMMAQAGMETVYASGGIASMIATNDPGTDHADYTYDTLPKRVTLLHRSQLLMYRTQATKELAEKCMMPIIADADSGFGQYTMIMKLAKMFVQAGAAGFHIDDLFPGSKRFDGKDGEGWVIVPCNEIVRRLSAAKLQLDIMGSEIVIVYRTDGLNATRITSDVDYRDRPFILGATVPMERDYASIFTSPERADWKAAAKLTTLDEAFNKSFPSSSDHFTSATKGMNTSEALRVALSLQPTFYWSSSSPRSIHGFFAFKGCLEASISRSCVVAPFVDMVWPNAFGYNAKVIEDFARGVHTVWPKKWLGYNITGTFPADGSQDEEVRGLPQRLADLGYVWQFMPLAGYTSIGLVSQSITKAIVQRGVLGYIEDVSRPAALAAANDGTPPVESWYKDMAKLTDTASEVIGEGYMP